MSALPLPPLQIGEPWALAAQPGPPSGSTLVLRRDSGEEVTMVVERCAAGRLRDAYPVGAYDLEVRIEGAPTAAVLTDVLGTMATALLAADRLCRRVVYAAGVDDGGAAAAEAAGLRHVLDVEVPGAELSLLVAEPEWVTRVDPDLDRVPGT